MVRGEVEDLSSLSARTAFQKGWPECTCTWDEIYRIGVDEGVFMRPTRCPLAGTGGDTGLGVCRVHKGLRGVARRPRLKLVGQLVERKSLGS